MQSVSMLRKMYEEAHSMLESTMADVTAEQAHYLPAGIANPIGATYAHALMGEDILVNAVARGAAALCASTWDGRAGWSEMAPEPPLWGDWARRVQIDLPAMREYAKAVYAATDEYLATLTAEDLDADLPEGALGGNRKLGDLLGAILIGHAYSHCGEIAALKGIQGNKGYPF